jgi:hypothetical protein
MTAGCRHCGAGGHGQVLTRDGVKLKRARPAEAPAWADSRDRGMSWWHVTLAYQGRELTTPFATGPGTPPPAVDDVLNCLLSDAAGWENVDGFEHWAREYGFETGEDYDPELDSGPDPAERPRAMYKRVEAQVERLRELLGGDYDAILWGE